MTNGDAALREAKRVVLPNEFYQPSSCHVSKNARENVKNLEFNTVFNRAMYSKFSPGEFDEFWKNIVLEHGLKKEKWVLKTYENKSMWAQAYLPDNFFVGGRTTSRCQGMNSFIKAFRKRKCSMVDFMHSFEQALRVLKQ